ncbi:hypothetical protein ONS95_007154 [Cadophora gregata]|uniref:uncharacterized protein n=1 Tax=Cadophora gregata TaxID=51156 RepID=UPI0026DB0FCD|nr:uncharacterized protein ONS95_007154 [Cadophora gregata]KAK0100703.1 hypothetical protein ONS95_007154 [Cadophora gregata]KAK0117301.1 hypothetical protein ONS96_013133 [Cadophora gregata f. sp. sojae]
MSSERGFPGTFADMVITADTLSDLELAQQGAQEAAQEISRASDTRAVQLQSVTNISSATPHQGGSCPDPTSDDSGHPQAFPNFIWLPLELQQKIYCEYGFPQRRIIKISPDNFLAQVHNEITGEKSIETILRAKATMFISPLASVCKESRKMTLGERYLTGFRLRYIRLYFNFVDDTLFFENAKALESLLGPLGDYEQRDAEEEEYLARAFGKDGPVGLPKFLFSCLAKSTKATCDIPS